VRVNLVIDAVRLLVVLFVHRPGEQPDLVVWILILLRVDLGLFSAFGLRLTVMARV
jgi:hypothetical protein